MKEEIIKRHGEKIFIMSQSDWEAFTAKVKADHPELYKVFKEEMNFEMTPVEF